MNVQNLIQQVRGPSQTSNEAISICLYRGKGYKPEDHYYPLVRFLKTYGEDRDVLLFIDESEYPFEPLPHHDKLRIFTVLPAYSKPGYLRHLYRYLGSLLSYDWTHHRGSDTPMVTPEINTLVSIAKTYNCPVITQASSWLRTNTVAGSCTLAKGAGQKFFNFLSSVDLTRYEESFYADETLLSSWLNANPLPTVYYIPEPLISHPLREYLLSRMLSGPRTIIVNTSGLQ
jgi:hypothetical protein